MTGIAAQAPPTVPSLPPLFVAVKTIGVITLAMLGASISSQLVDLDIADIGGAFSVSADQASWIACVATMAEVAGIPIAATLVRALSMRTLVLWTAAVFAFSALLSLQVDSELALLSLRAVQSFCSGILSVLLFVAVMATLPAGTNRSIGLTIFGLASSAPGALAAPVGAFVTESFGWRGLYYFDISWSLVLLLLAWRLLRPAPPVMRLSQIDWLSYALISIGLAALILFMKQGDRFFWLESPTIVWAGVVAAAFILLAILALLIRRQPLMDLHLLMKPTFGWAVTLATCYRFALVMSAFVVPQALTRLQGFRIPEIADATVWMFWAECVAFPLAWFWASRGDARHPLSVGLLLFAVGALISTNLTPEWQAGDFRLTLFAIGFGQGLFLVPTVFYSTRDVAPQQGTTAAALFNLSRVVGQTFGIAAFGSLITEREKFHSAILVDAFNNANPAFVQRYNGLVASFFARYGDSATARLQAWKSLSGTASNQAYVLAFADAFFIIAIVLAVSALLVLMLPPLRPKPATLEPSAEPGAAGQGTMLVTGVQR
jgi:DHA2 family multidrug resistance protein